MIAVKIERSSNTIEYRDVRVDGFLVGEVRRHPDGWEFQPNDKGGISWRERFPARNVSTLSLLRGQLKEAARR